MLRKGDRLTITRRMVVPLGQYDALKPSVSLTRELGDDPEADRQDMERICYVELRRALLDEVRSRTQATRLLGDEQELTPLLKRCEKVIKRGYEKARPGLAEAEEDEGPQEFQTERAEKPQARERRRRRSRRLDATE